MFLTIYTPAFKRPTLLQRCIESVNAQYCSIQHVIVQDNIGIGIGEVYSAIADNVNRFHGEYVYVLQDDDMLAAPNVVHELQHFVENLNNPDVVIVNNDKAGIVYPLTHVGCEPIMSKIDLGSYVVRSDVFIRNVDSFGKRHEGDFDFIHALWNRNYVFTWSAILFARSQLTEPGHYRTEDQMNLKVLLRS